SNPCRCGSAPWGAPTSTGIGPAGASGPPAAPGSSWGRSLPTAPRPPSPPLLLPAMKVPEPLIARLVERTQALPQLLCDLVDGLKREGLLARQAGGMWCGAAGVR